MRGWLSLAIVVLVGVGPVMAATYYVSPSGTGDGSTESTPMSWATWKGSDRSGDTCYIVDMNETISEDFYWPGCQGYYAKYVQVYSAYSVGFTFSEYKRVFQWANGDIGVVGPVSITALTPSPQQVNIGGTLYDVHGTMVDPVVSWSQSFHGKGTSYSADGNVGPGIAAGSPYTLTPGHTMVHTHGKTVADSEISWVYEAAALHAVESVPSVLSFRPTYAGGSAVKTIYAASEVDMSRLGNLAVVGSGYPTKATAAATTRTLWLEKIYSYPNRYIHPMGSRASYGSYLSSWFNVCALWTNTNQAEADKLMVVRNLVQAGIDVYGMIQSNTYGRRILTPDNGGHGQSKLRFAYAAWLLHDDDMIATLAKTGDYIDTTRSNKYWPSDIVISSETQAHSIQESDILSMPWKVGGEYWGNNAGTVNVTHGSTTVTGNGTSWMGIAAANRKRIALVSNGIASDDRGYDVNARAYNIASVVSDTELTLTTPYTGETATGKAYWIAGAIVYGHGSVVGMMDDSYGNAEDTREPTAEDIGLPIWGIGWGYPDYEYPNVSAVGKGWYTGSIGDFTRKYQPTFLQACGGATLCALIMGMRDVWNSESTFNYADRAATVMDLDSQWWNGWERQMWEAYRHNYPPVWTPKCHTPIPPHQATGVPTTQVLSWYDGNGRATGTSCNVYFGTDQTPDETELVASGSTSYSYAPELEAGTTYYWRVDEVCPGGTYTGDVWSFTTEGETTTKYLLIRRGS